jgi:membrane-bound ClpP family serine protease
MRGVPAERARHVALQRQLQEGSAELERRKAERAANEIAQERCAALQARVAAGDFGDARAHLRRPSMPSSPADVRLGKLASVWSAVSVGVLLLAVAVLSYFSGLLAPGIVALLGVYGFFEALFHRSVQEWLARLVVALAVVTVLVLLLRFFQPVVLGAVVLMGLFIIVENVRELLT